MSLRFGSRLRLREKRVVEMHHFCDEASFAAFRLPPTPREA